jgi:ATP-dependent Clp protease ATP-binding subunit ClpA
LTNFLMTMPQDFMTSSHRVEPESVLLHYLLLDHVGEWIAKNSSAKKVRPYAETMLGVISTARKNKSRYIIHRFSQRPDGLPYCNVREDLLKIIGDIDTNKDCLNIFTAISLLPNISQEALNVCSMLVAGQVDLRGNKSKDSSSEINSVDDQDQTDNNSALREKAHFSVLFEEVPTSTRLMVTPTKTQSEYIDVAIKISHRKLHNVPIITGQKKTGKTTIVNLIAQTLSKSTKSKVFRLKNHKDCLKYLSPLVFSNEGVVLQNMSEIMTSLLSHNHGIKPIIILDGIDQFLKGIVPHFAHDKQVTPLFNTFFGSNLISALSKDAFVFGTTQETPKTGRGLKDDSHSSALNQLAAVESKVEQIISKSSASLQIKPLPVKDLSVIIDAMVKEREAVSGQGLTFSLDGVKMIGDIVRNQGMTSTETAHKIIDQAMGVALSYKVTKISGNDIIEAASIITNLPRQSIEMLAVTQNRSLSDLGRHLKTRIFGQDKAIQSLEEKLKISLCGLNDDNKPIGSFMFVGPTGVGKTELARETSKFLHMNLIRIDMSEYSDDAAINKLIGSPPGYRDGERGGVLSNALKEFPNSVLLLDESEKANPLIHNIFLQMMDNGEFRDGMGETVSCRNSIIIFTSNAGASDAKTISSIRNTIGFASNESDSVSSYNKGMSKAVQEGMARQFPPEFRNRLDAVVIFNPIDLATAKSITQKILSDLSKKVLERHKVNVTYTNSLVDRITTEGYDIEYGARNIIRAVDKIVKTAIADLFSGNPSEHFTDETVLLEQAENDEIVTCKILEKSKDPVDSDDLTTERSNNQTLSNLKSAG